MKRIVVLGCMLAMAALPAMVSAQGLPSLGGIPGISGLGSLFGGTGPCGEAKPGLVAPPTFYVGYLAGSANFGAGFDNTVGNVNGLDHTYRLESLALGLSDAFALSDRIAVIASGWWIVPAATHSSQYYDIAAAAAPGSAHRTWSAETNWWWVDALAAYSISGGFSALAGFRWDRFETRFKDPETDIFASAASDEANVKSNGYIPLLGVLYSAGTSASMLSAYAVGFPTLLGRAEYHETSTSLVTTRVNVAGNYNAGFFFETRLDYKRRVMADADLGAFFRYNATRGTFSGTFTGSNIPVSPAFRGGLNRQSFTLGGTLNLPFRLPFM